MPTQGNPTIQVRLDPATKARFEAEAHNRGLKPAELARALLCWWLGEPGATLPQQPNIKEQP